MKRSPDRRPACGPGARCWEPVRRCTADAQRSRDSPECCSRYNRPGDPDFDHRDLELLAGYANHAALVLQLAHARHDNARLRSTNDRRQIAEDLHHHMLHRVSRLGIDLHGVAARLHANATSATVRAKIDETDEIIH